MACCWVSILKRAKRSLAALAASVPIFSWGKPPKARSRSYLPALPAIARELGSASTSLTLFVLAFGVAQLVCGPLADRFGRRRVIWAAFGALALVLSQRLPDLWFVLDRLFVKAGRFYRRERGVKLNLVPATNVHLTRAVRGALRDLL